MQLWHQQLGHAGLFNFCNIADHVTGIPDIINDCGYGESCAMTKLKRRSFKGTRSSKYGILEKAQSDWCGPISPKSVDGFVGYINIVDGKSSWITANPLAKFKSLEE
ncbi:hypothetical protein HK096_010357 [Nowakowskiella sp. JEL0078]|nr:hypothetical protein HK096_010357 [Nowakowskiella sp. JEL0078]